MHIKRLKNNGFTLVEMIIVLVILAILSAIIVPALLGYIDQAKKKQSVLNAKNCLNAMQVELSKLYAKQKGDLILGQNVIPDVASSDGLTAKFSPKNGDTDLRDTDFANRVLDMVDLNGDKKPYCLLVGVGSNNLKTDNKYKQYVNYTSLHDKYTVYYILYIEEKGDDYCYYYNGDWAEINPTQNGGDIKKNDVFNDRNYVLKGPLKNKRIQYYLISYGGNDDFMTKTFWDDLKAGTA